MSACSVIVEFVVRPDAVSTFHDLVLANARASLEREAGCRRFDVMVPEHSDDRVLLYEIYDDRAAFDAHSASAHYESFAAAIRDIVVRKTVTICRTVDPGDGGASR